MMKLTVKTLKGGKFQVDCDALSTVLQVKGFIVSTAREKSPSTLSRYEYVRV